MSRIFCGSLRPLLLPPLPCPSDRIRSLPPKRVPGVVSPDRHFHSMKSLEVFFSCPFPQVPSFPFHLTAITFPNDIHPGRSVHSLLILSFPHLPLTAERVKSELELEFCPSSSIGSCHPGPIWVSGNHYPTFAPPYGELTPVAVHLKQFSFVYPGIVNLAPFRTTLLPFPRAGSAFRFLRCGRLHLSPFYKYPAPFRYFLVCFLTSAHRSPIPRSRCGFTHFVLSMPPFSRGEGPTQVTFLHA